MCTCLSADEVATFQTVYLQITYRNSTFTKLRSGTGPPTLPIIGNLHQLPKQKLYLQ